MRTVCCLIVIPRSRSRSMESSTWSTAFLGSMAPVRASSRSARVDLPWSMWATMEKFRIRESATKFRISRDDFVFPDYGAGGDPRPPPPHPRNGHPPPPPHVTAPGSGRGEGRVHDAFEEVHLREAVLLRAPDVLPVRPGREAVGGGPAFPAS